MTAPEPVDLTITRLAYERDAAIAALNEARADSERRDLEWARDTGMRCRLDRDHTARYIGYKERARQRERELDERHRLSVEREKELVAALLAARAAGFPVDENLINPTIAEVARLRVNAQDLPPAQIGADGRPVWSFDETHRCWRLSHVYWRAAVDEDGRIWDVWRMHAFRSYPRDVYGETLSRCDVTGAQDKAWAQIQKLEASAAKQ